MLDMMPKILATGGVHESSLKVLEGFVSIEGKAPSVTDRDQAIEMIADKDGILIANLLRVDRRMMERAPNLKVISTISVGYDHIDIEEATNRGIYVCNTPGILTDCVAETTWALILACYKRIAEADRFVRTGGWTRGLHMNEFLGFDLKGKTLGVVGLGRIGQRVAEVARCFGMSVIYYDLIRPSDEGQKGFRYVDLNELMKESDIITLHLPLTKDTLHIIDRERIGLMKRGSFLVNTARGSIVEEEALVDALKAGSIGGAGLDVYEEEPLKQESALSSFPNVVLSPHRGSASAETRSKMAEFAALNLISVLKGQMPPALVNPEVLKVRPLNEVKMSTS